MSIYKNWNNVQKAAWEYAADFVACGPETRVDGNGEADVAEYIEYQKKVCHSPRMDRIRVEDAGEIWALAQRWLRQCHWREKSAGVWEYDANEAFAADERGIGALARLEDILKWDHPEFVTPDGVPPHSVHYYE